MFDVVKTVFSALMKAMCCAVGLILFFLTVVAGLWTLLFILYVFIPNEALDDRIAAIARNYFEPARETLGLSDRYVAEDDPSEVSLAIASNWQRCFPAAAGDEETLGPEDRARLAVQRKAKYQAESVYMYLRSYKSELIGMRRLASTFAAMLIVLGMATTIVSALNSSELGAGSGRTAIVIKVTAIMLPALGTMVTAFAALYASSDQAAAKAQLLYNLSALNSEMNEAYLAAPCPVTAATNLSDMEAKFVNWSKRLSEIVANAEYTTGQVKAAPSDGNKK
ncbi:hypothetical protein [Rhizobium leguminosarum]|uniref:hypothetical protein n=1 Tax=Rhizobium leguminosarum TaxID=384 RepID=UPI001031F0BD|nr:hypothetical protein [Rhizobium leguminosarum]TAV44984.1 hypothetical protein ELI29_29965 [Rhizobium leguminosarum]